MLYRRLVHLTAMLCLASGALALSSAMTSQSASAMILPPRPTVPPTAVPAPAARAGAIAVTVADPPSAGWVEVQWLDGLGRWHNVESWPGELKNGWAVRWVLPEDFGTGPFRWVVYERQGGPMRATSPSFYFPRAAGEWVLVDVTRVAPTAPPTATVAKTPVNKATPTPTKTAP